MKIKFSTAIVAVIIVLFSSNILSYDQQMADSYYRLFQPVAGAKAGKALHLMPPDVFIESIKQGKQLVTLDVRTPAESGIYSMTLPGSLAIQISELFKFNNLQKLPTDKPLVIVCLSGVRATAAGTALRHIGFNNVYILKGGFKGLTGYLDPKVANMPAKAK